MRFNPKADISGGRASGSSGGGGGLGGGGGMGGGLGGLPIPGGFGIKGTIVIIVIYLIMSACGVGPGLGGVLGGGNDNSGNQATGTDNTYADCKTGEDANKSRTCERKALMLSLENFWKAQFKGQDFPTPTLHTFNGQTQTGCGAASAGMGPFYCPTDQNIYEDPSFYKQVLEGQLGGSDAPFVEPYVLGHEYGHHIQNITGEMKNVRSQQGADSDAVKLELEADCYAGFWTQAATKVTDSNGEPIFAEISDQDIKDAIKAAWSVGDDHIQQTTQGRIDEGSFTHGSSEQRMQWFKTGFAADDRSACTAIWG